MDITTVNTSVNKKTINVGYNREQVARPRKNNTDLSPVCQAVIDLRKALGLTQQEMAFTFGVAVTTIARYETGRIPESNLLAKLSFVARSHGYVEIADVLHSEIKTVLGSEAIDKGPVIESHLREAQRSLFPLVWATIEKKEPPPMAQISDDATKAYNEIGAALKLLKELDPAYEINRALSMLQINRK